MNDKNKASTTCGFGTQAHNLDKNKLKQLYELSKEVLKDEDNRRMSIDDKATKFIPVLAILLGSAAFFGKWLLEKNLVPPQGKFDWFALVCVTLVFVIIIVSWVHVLLILRVQEYRTLSIDKEVIDYFWDNDLASIYGAYANFVFLPDIETNRKIGDNKARLLIYSHYGILTAALLLILLLILVGCHTWLTSPKVANWNAILEVIQ